MDRKKLIDKVVKLLSLSKNNSNKAEAESAKDMAATLMAKYDISVIEAQEAPEFNTDERELTRLAVITYDAWLINIISKFNGVAYITQPGYSRGKYKMMGKNIFVGRKSDIEVNDYMLEIIFQQRTHYWKEYLKEYRAAFGKAPKDTQKSNWMKSYAIGLQGKLRELIELKENKVEERGLVPVNMRDQALKFYNELHRTRQGKSRSFNGMIDHGYNAGKKTSIHKGISKQSGVKLIN